MGSGDVPCPLTATFARTGCRLVFEESSRAEQWEERRAPDGVDPTVSMTPCLSLCMLFAEDLSPPPSQLNDALKTAGVLVGFNITLADIAVFGAIFEAVVRSLARCFVQGCSSPALWLRTLSRTPMNAAEAQGGREAWARQRPPLRRLCAERNWRSGDLRASAWPTHAVSSAAHSSTQLLLTAQQIRRLREELAVEKADFVPPPPPEVPPGSLSLRLSSAEAARRG